jgi:hypothetical protein
VERMGTSGKAMRDEMCAADVCKAIEVFGERKRGKKVGSRSWAMMNPGSSDSLNVKEHGTSLNGFRKQKVYDQNEVMNEEEWEEIL